MKKAFLLNIFLLLGIFFLFIFSLQFGYKKINDLRSKISQAKKDVTVLRQKIDILEEIGNDSLFFSDLSLNALPETNPSLIVISQLKKLANDNGVIFFNTKTGLEMPDKPETKKVSVSFEIEGPREFVTQFLRSIKNISPLTLIEKIKISEPLDITQAEVSVEVFWASLPKKLPALLEAIEGLTVEEKETLDSLSSLIQPAFFVLPPAKDEFREDPFSQ